MAVPKRKVTPARRGKRRAHDRIGNQAWHECPQCGEMKMPHHICGYCGYYNDKAVITQIEDDAA